MSALALLADHWQLERDWTNRRCIESDCITWLCRYNAGPRCYCHAAKHKPTPLYLADDTEAQHRALDELLKLPPGWEGKVAA